MKRRHAGGSQRTPVGRAASPSRRPTCQVGGGAAGEAAQAGSLRHVAVWQTALLAVIVAFLCPQARAAEAKAITLNGGIEDGKARLVIEALLNGSGADRDKVIVTTTLQHRVEVGRNGVTNRIGARLQIFQGQPEELVLGISGEGEVLSVTGPEVLDWSVRRGADGARSLVIRPKRGEKPISELAAEIVAVRELRAYATPLPGFTLSSPQPLLGGSVRIDMTSELDVRVAKPEGLLPIRPEDLPTALRGETKSDAPEPLAFQIQGASYALPLTITPVDPEARRVVLRDFKLTGRFEDDTASFTLKAVAKVNRAEGGSVMLASGSGVALTEVDPRSGGRVAFAGDRFYLVFDRAGEFPVTLKFNAAVTRLDGWSALDFKVGPSTLLPVVLEGLPVETEFRFEGAAKPERVGATFVSHLPPDGSVKLAWKTARPEAEGRLFYAAEMLSEISVGPGLMRQVALLNGKVMQGELGRLALRLRGTGEVTRVLGDAVLAWNLEPIEGSKDRRLVVQFNQPQKVAFALQVQMQTALAAFPLAAEPLLLQPEEATRFSGHYRIVNDGAVRLEVVQATGLSQVSPEQFPETDATKAAFRAAGQQRFAYRFSGGDLALRIQADQIQPEVAVSQLLAYHHGENERRIDAEIELDVREAPLRELLLSVPKGFVVLQVNGGGLNDHFLRDTADAATAELRLVFGQPLIGRQMIQLRLERNRSGTETNWALPRVAVLGAKSVRGFVGVSADAGFRLTPERTEALTEIATAFFPRRTAGLQAAFRLADGAWEAAVRVERLPQTVQAEALHLFSIGEGVAYGSSVLNYQVSGAPVASFRVELSDEYFNVEFAGKDLRNWQKTTNGYVVQLHTPVAGTYTLLATYERPFKGQGETLTFTGARPLDAQSEQGHTLVTSAYQFRVQPAEVSPGLLALEPGEVPAEHRLFFDAPILAAYRYTARPFNLRLALSPLAQGDSLSQVVDRASLVTRISQEGQVLTDVRYYVKNRGNPHLRVTLPPETQLWSATVDGRAVVPVTDATANLIPLPQNAAPDAVLVLDLKLATRSKNATRIALSAPVVAAPVMLAEWKLEPDTGRRLVHRTGSLQPVGGATESSGFAQWGRALVGGRASGVWFLGFAALVLVGIAVGVLRWATRPGTHRFSLAHCGGAVVALVALVMAGLASAELVGLLAKHRSWPTRELMFLAPVQQANSALSVEVGNVPLEAAERSAASWGLAVLAVGAWIYGAMRGATWTIAVGWTLLAVAALLRPNGGTGLIWVVAAFSAIHVVWPEIARMFALPKRPQPPTGASSEGGNAAATAAVLAGLLWLGTTASVSAATLPNPLPREPRLPESVVQEIRVTNDVATAKATLRWTAEKGQVLPLLFEPAVLVRAEHPASALKLVSSVVDGKRVQQLVALESGTFDVTLNYQLPVKGLEGPDGRGPGLVLPTQFGLVNRLKLTVQGQDVDVVSAGAASVRRALVGGDTVAELVLRPANGTAVLWKPLSRDVRREKPVFYAEWAQLYSPVAGVVEGVHHVQIRPAQGELAELVFDVPAGSTITDVATPIPPGAEQNTAFIPQLVSLWRFDPETRKLRVTLSAQQSKPFALLIRSQIATGPLPMERTTGLLEVIGAAGQVGSVGVATGNEVQLDEVAAETFPAINLEDFPAHVLEPLRHHIAGLTLRRAFRQSEEKGTLSLKASAVEADVRVEAQDTVSLGEDRTLLASTLDVTVTRAGIFRLSFELPAGMDVETISGAALSHWTELKTVTNRIVTLNLRGRTEGAQQFKVNLVGGGVKATNGWAVPKLVLREASKQTGTLVLVPEQGMRLQAERREGVSQLDPQQSGIRQKGVLAFRVLQADWAVALEIEQVDPWIQVSGLQHANVGEAQIKVTANLQFQIENTGLKAFRVLLATNAENVRFLGEQVADFLPVEDGATNGLRAWDVKLRRRVIGTYLLQATYQLPVAGGANQVSLRGVEVVGVNLQRGFVTVQSGGRLQVRAKPPAQLQPTEWQGIPRNLQKDLPEAAASFAFRLVEPGFELPLTLERHEAAKLLPARVTRATFTSVISDDGAMLTQARLDLLPGDKRLLHLSLPKDATFWFAFVNQNGVWPWTEQDRILIPLEQQAADGKPVPVEIFFTSKVGSGGKRALDLALVAPKFDLPLEDIRWRVFLGEKWDVSRWSGALQLERDEVVALPASAELGSYLQKEAVQRQEKSREAEQMLVLGNQALAQGDPQQARRAFQNAYGLSQHDNAFNEDARVQLSNLKKQQAWMGLNNLQNIADGGEQRRLNYTQEDAKRLMERNPADDNTALMRLAERIVQQQDAAVASPAVIRASVPEQGRLLTFKRAVMVETWADLGIRLKAEAQRAFSGWMRVGIVAGLAAIFAVVLGARRAPR